MVRADGARFVLVDGLHRLEAAKALGEKTIVGFRVEGASTERPPVVLAGDAAVLVLRLPPNKGAASGRAPNQNASKGRFRK